MEDKAVRLLAILFGLILALPLRADTLVAAASSLRFALDEILAAWRAETGIPVRVVYGSSGNLARQMAQGAPFSLFLSADSRSLELLSGKRALAAGPVIYGRGRLVLLAGRHARYDPQSGVEGLVAAIAKGQVRRIAIANPDHAPYGRAALALLQRALPDEQFRSRLVFGENVAQAAQFVMSGSADVGIVALSLVRSGRLSSAGRHALVPAALHPPLEQPMVLLAGADQQSRALFDYLRSERAAALFRAWGVSE